MNKPFSISIFYSKDKKLFNKTFVIMPDTTIQCFLEKYNLSHMIKNSDIGVFGNIKKLNYVLKPNDRLEIYSDIKLDPKIRRKKRSEF